MKNTRQKQYTPLKYSPLCKCVFFIIIFICQSTQAKLAISAKLESDSLSMIEYNKKGADAIKIGDFEMAKEHFIKALRIREINYGSNSIRLASILNNIGVSNKNLGEYNAAIKNYLQAEKIYINEYSENHPRLGSVYINLGIIYKLQGDYLKYNEYQNNAIRVLSNDSQRLKSSIEKAEYSLAESLFLLKHYDNAIVSSEQNLKKVSGDIESFYTNLLARIYTEIGNSESADKYHKETIDLIKKYYGKESYDLGIEYLDYVSFLLSTERYNDALYYNQLAEQIIEKYYTQKSTYYSEVMMHYADYYFSRQSEASALAGFNQKKKEDLQKALNYYQQAIIANSQLFSDIDQFSNPQADEAISEIQMLAVLKKKALCYEALGDITFSNTTESTRNFQAAFDAITVSTDLIHQIRTGFISEDSRIFLSENQESTFFDAVNICYKLYELTSDVAYAYKGYEFTEKSKSASFLAAVKDSKAQEFGEVPDSLINKGDILKLNISNYKEMLFEENQQADPDTQRIALYNSKLFQYSEQYSKLVTYLEDYYPNYYSFKYGNEVVDINSVREKLNQHDAIIEYLIQEPDENNNAGKLFRFVITEDEFEFSANNIDNTFVEDIENVYQFLTNPAYLHTGIDDYKLYSESSFELYSKLLGDIKDELEGKQLTIIPDDKLSYIPFDALLTAMPDTSKMNFRNLPYLVHDFSISYTYSTTLHYNYFEKGKEASKDLLAFAPNYINDDRDVTDISTFRSGLSPLPAVEKEVEYISKFVTSDIFKDEFAQEKDFKELASDYDILHLAMHTILNDTLPMYSRLAFAKPTNNSGDDGWLNTSEIYNMQLQARMAVLSACNTGSGKLQKGEGVMSLARGFLYAGCPSIIMTLWEVEDESGALIMKDFYRMLSQGKSKDEALRLAKLSHIKSADPLKAHPHYWLGYVAVGNSEPLFTSKDLYFMLALFGIIILIFIDQTYRKKKKAKIDINKQ